MSDSVRPHRQQPTRLHHPWDSPGKNTGAGCHFLLQCRKVKNESEVAQSCPTLSNPMDCSLAGSSAHGIFQARVLEWVAIAFSEIHSTDIQITKHTHTCISELQLQDSWAVQKRTVESNCAECFLQLLPSMVELINFGRHPSMPSKQSH